jgi:hypothetical protein
MKIRNRLLIRALAALAALLIRTWVGTLRVRMTSADHQQHPTDPAVLRYLYAFWHEALIAPIAKRGRKVQVLISQHADGELIAQICRWLGVGVVRGSSTKGGSQALLEMIRGGDRHAHLIFTPDGPRGPRRQLKPGLVMVASQAALSIVPIGIGFTSAWRVSSWDRLAIPRPFSTMVGVVGEPILVPENLDRGGLQAYVRLVEEQISLLTVQAEAWAESLRLGREQVPRPARAASTLRKSA